MNAKQYLGLILTVVVGFAWAGRRVEADTYRYGGTQVNNLITVVNQHKAKIANLQSKLVQLAAKLDGDGGVTATDFAAEVANSDAPVTSTTTVDLLSR